VKAKVMFGPYQHETLNLVLGDGGGVIFDEGVLGNAVSANSKGTTYKFKGVKGVGGISRATIKEDKKVPGQLKIIVKVNYGWAAPAADETEATTDVVLNLGGTCFEGSATDVR
jgi:hypothetical protein